MEEYIRFIIVIAFHIFWAFLMKKEYDAYEINGGFFIMIIFYLFTVSILLGLIQ